MPTPSEARPESSHPFEAYILAAELGGAAPSADLHGMDRERAIEAVEHLLFQTYQSPEAAMGPRAVKIIHGRGKGVLRREVLDYLSHHNLVEYVRDASDPKQMSGVTFAVVSRRE